MNTVVILREHDELSMEYIDDLILDFMEDQGYTHSYSGVEYGKRLMEFEIDESVLEEDSMTLSNIEEMLRNTSNDISIIVKDKDDD